MGLDFDKLNVLVEELTQEKDVKYCKNCGQEMISKAIFCKACGNDTFFATKAEYNTSLSKKICTGCGEILDKDDQFCYMCRGETFLTEVEFEKKKIAEEEERKRIEEEERKRKAEEERKRQEEAERKRKEEEERKRREAEERKRKEEEERRRREEAERKRREEEERRRKAEEERKRQEEAERRRKAEEERKRQEEAERKRQEEEERKRREEEERIRKAEEERKRQEAKEHIFQKAEEAISGELEKIHRKILEAIMLDDGDKVAHLLEEIKEPVGKIIKETYDQLKEADLYGKNNEVGERLAEKVEEILVQYQEEAERLKAEEEAKKREFTNGLRFTKRGNAVEVTGYSGTSTKVVIPSIYDDLPVTSIKFGAFSDCTSLTSVTIPNSVTSIGMQAFLGCTSLTSVIISNSVRSIGDSAFSNCTSLTSVIIPDSVTSIGDDVFFKCTSLTSVTIPDSVTIFGDDVFEFSYSLQYNEYGNAYYLGNEHNPYIILIKVKDTRSTSCEIHNSTKFIHSSAFRCSDLTTITIPDSVISIGSHAFSLRDSLRTVTIGSNVNYIGPNAFWKCKSLTNVVFKNPNGWSYESSGERIYREYGMSARTSGWRIASTDLSKPEKAAKYLRSQYNDKYWYRTK